jgi:hypothetical protein
MSVQQNDDNPDPSRNAKWYRIEFAKLSKDSIFFISLLYALAMLFVAVLHRFGKIDLFEMKDFLVPLSIPWFGAIGAITISLQAVFERRDDWDPAYNYWHLARPLLGAILGIMSFLILSVIVTLAGSTPPTPTAAPTIASMNIFHVLAFIVGYREETFRDLLKRVTDLILRPDSDRDSAN